MMLRCERRGPIYPPQPPRWGHRRTKRTISIKIMKKEEGRNQPARKSGGDCPAFVCL
ncbi:hypothetical protein SUBVAR_04443 [Subdoligranulum variabile DSM 15176]|uniref:Uncharacterized protein n=1 Tax=Subdoligranulum variabile DSM 15176 TaxID=411471 RepID=D1PJC2_9FIRM|nr:hypothetical protein SUBVAR_04443 [Subdoligranulum variabile DSM 15176]